MPSQFDQFKQQWLAGATQLATKNYGDFLGAAEQDAQSFLEEAAADLARWTAMLGDGTHGTLSRDDFIQLVQGEDVLAELHSLKQAGLAAARWDMFTNALLDLTVQLAFKVFLPVPGTASS
jgi:hypothetical protein